MSVIVTKDTYLSNGDRQVTISPNCYLMQRKITASLLLRYNWWQQIIN